MKILRYHYITWQMFLGLVIVLFVVIAFMSSVTRVMKRTLSEDKLLTREKQILMANRRELPVAAYNKLRGLQRRLSRVCPLTSVQLLECIQAQHLPTIYMITPTYKRNVQRAELTRLSQTLMLVPKLHWIVVEDSEEKTKLVSEILINSGLMYTHLNILSPKPNKCKGLLQRNLALSWLRENLNANHSGVVYFGDDDNTYSLKIFDEMRNIKRIGVWPVAFVGGIMAERPLVGSKGTVTGWSVGYFPNRKFAIDMAGFAINLRLVLEKQSTFQPKVSQMENSFLLGFNISLAELEPKADNCTKIYVWHTVSGPTRLNQENKFIEKIAKNHEEASSYKKILNYV